MITLGRTIISMRPTTPRRLTFYVMTAPQRASASSRKLFRRYLHRFGYNTVHSRFRTR
jgi:hypothetical protein